MTVDLTTRPAAVPAEIAAAAEDVVHTLCGVDQAPSDHYVIGPDTHSLCGWHPGTWEERDSDDDCLDCEWVEQEQVQRSRPRRLHTEDLRCVDCQAAGR